MIACNDDGRDLFSKDELDEDFIKARTASVGGTERS